MFKNLLIAMDLSPASICLLRCVGPLRGAGAESATLIHVMDVHKVGGCTFSLKYLVLCGDFFRHPLFATDFSGPAERAFHFCSPFPSSSLIWKLSGVLTGKTECVVY